jgi:putative ABC transport system substrate-binding protein
MDTDGVRQRARIFRRPWLVSPFIVASLIIGGGLVFAAPVQVLGQQPALPTVGVLAEVSHLPASSESVARARTRTLNYVSRADALVDGLRDAGYLEGVNIKLETRLADPGNDLNALASDLVRYKPAVIVTIGTSATLAAIRAGHGIPIVMVGVADPVQQGLVTSLGRPGGNVTGLSLFGPELTIKGLELLMEAAPHVAKVGILFNQRNPGARLTAERIETAARPLGVTLWKFAAAGAGELSGVLAEIAKEQVQALIVINDGVFMSEVDQIVAFAMKRRLATVFQLREYVERGGLISYSPRIVDMTRRAAHFVDRILRGAKPADLPVEQPTKFELAINSKAARELGLTIPWSLLLRADHIIE